MESQQKQPDFLVGFAHNKDNGYLGEIIGVSGLFHPQTQLIDALIESCAANSRTNLSTIP